MSNYNTPANFHDLTGQRFGRLVVQLKIGTNNKGNVEWLCLCDCGNKTVATTVNLNRGHTRSCGCLQLDIRTRHGEVNSRLYGIWENIKQRCNNPNCSSYSWYGQRGISICDDWNDYISFRNWALEHGYADDLSIDRIDVNGNYEPNNCRWATDLEQSNNKRTNLMISYFNETHSLADWCRIFNLPYDLIHTRL